MRALDTLEYEFDTEKKFSYDSLSMPEMVKHISRFIADIWQIHPFGEGNTRTTAVFTILLPKKLPKKTLLVPKKVPKKRTKVPKK